MIDRTYGTLGFILRAIRDLAKDFLYGFTIVRRLSGGAWYKNRYWFDMGRSMIIVWERECLGYIGGTACTLSEESF